MELGFTPEQTAREVQRCLNCDVETHFTANAVHRVRRLRRRLPDELPDDHHQRRADADLRQRLSAPAVNLDPGDLRQSDALPQTKRVMVKDEDVCLHCGLCAERCPTAAWDMRKFDLLVPYAGAACR